MMENPSEYLVRPRMIQNVIKAFFGLLWSGHPKLNLDVLNGPHTEVAAVSISTGSECYACGVAPMITPNKKQNGSVYVTHNDAVQIYRWELATFLSQRATYLDRETIMHAINTRANLHYLSTLQRTAMQLPFYNVAFE
eukprot:gnl/Spiro4/22441_TR11061_c0_g3_i1.p2 gnl/Spiro4/22441_TR11061_c0_g3~~gnl/Spiro4/22441_TR11061_c0_g3_i1.p2  ORF type:complete len:138 (-),score=47.40 gnl/Spiro4/22441_TR11061_c0_g3_i1:19-432(-)